MFVPDRSNSPKFLVSTVYIEASLSAVLTRVLSLVAVKLV